MAALSGTLTDQTPSADFIPTEASSDVVITQDQPGQVLLECKAPGQTKYSPVGIVAGAFDVGTRDTSIVYRFRALTPVTSIHYYMGP